MTEYTIEQRNVRWEWVAAAIGLIGFTSAIYLQDFVGDRGAERRMKTQIEATYAAEPGLRTKDDCVSRSIVTNKYGDMQSVLYDDFCDGRPNRGELYRSEQPHPLVHWEDINEDGRMDCWEKFLDMEEDGLNGNEIPFECEE